MRRAEALDRLGQHRADLHRLGVARLFLYGSVARDQADPGSDVDLPVEPGNDRFSPFDLMRVQVECTRLPGRRAELHDYRGLARAPEFRARVSADLVNVFWDASAGHRDGASRRLARHASRRRGYAGELPRERGSFSDR